MTLSERDIRLRVSTLPERFQDRLPEDYPILSGDRDCGEWLEVVENLVMGLHQDRPRVSTRERDELRLLLDAMKPPRVSPKWIEELATVRSLTETELLDQVTVLVERFRARIPEPDRPMVTSPHDRPTTLDTVDNLLTLLLRHRIPVSIQERTDLWLILDALDLPRTALARLTTG